MLELLEVSRDETDGEIGTFEGLLHPDDVDRVETAIERAIETGEPYQIEQRIENADGEYVWFDVRGRIVEGEPSLMIGVGIDITERKAAERRLREEQQFVRGIFRSLPDPLYTFDTEGYPIRWNETFEAVTGYSSEEIENTHITDLVPDDETGTIAAGFQSVLDDGRPVTVESAFETKDGVRVPYEFAVGPLEAADGTVQGVTGIGRNIVDRAALERRLKALNRTTQELMSAETRDEVLTIGVETTRDLLGLRANSIHLYDEGTEELVPAAVTDAVYDLVGDPPTFTGEDSIAWRVYQRGETLVLDDVREDPDIYNPETPVQSELYLPLGEYGVLIATSRSSETFDERDVLLGEILAGGLVTALEQVDRTDQLRTRERELTEQNDRLEEFVSIVSHDLRNPLTVAEGRLQLAFTECDSEHLEHVERAHGRMRMLIRDLLALAREGEAVLDAEAVDLASLTESCWKTVETGDATLVTDIERTVKADESRLKQLFENLIRNAVEHGGESVTVTVGALADGFYVEDDGPGIPADERENVFEAGYSTREDGTGFGLSIVTQVVEALGWSIRVTDGDEGGARFEIADVEFVDE